MNAIYGVPAGFIGAQIDAVFSDLAVDAVKIGMLFRPATVKAAAEGLARHHARNIVLDPVTIASSGDSLLGGEVIDVLRRRLIPRALLVTPNLPEAAALVGASRRATNGRWKRRRARYLALGARNVLIKGGHGAGEESVDLLIGEGAMVRLSAKQISTKNLHGTGCTLSSAIAAGLAKGRDLITATQEAKALRHRGHRRRRPTQGRPRSRAAASFLCSRRMTPQKHARGHDPGWNRSSEKMMRG